MPGEAICNNIPYETHCSACGAEYRNIQHPMKPLGVIMSRECDCKLVTTVQRVGDNAISTTTKVPPERPA
jgi:hypothetical protein